MEPEPRRAAPDRLPRRVYWFRRGVVLVAVGLVIALIVWLSSLPSNPRSAGTSVKPPLAPPSSGTPSVLDSTQATALPGPDTSTASTPAAPSSATPSAASLAVADCDPGILTLSVSGPGVIKAGATGQFTVTVTNSGLSACLFTFDSRFAFTIVSGTDRIWSTSDCAQWAPTGSQQLAVGAAATWQTTWDRHRSEPTCKVVQTTLGAGTYVANAFYSGSATAQRVVLLTS